MITIYHHPRCSKSQEALSILTAFTAERDVPLRVIDYLATPPAVAELQALQRKLGASAQAMVRSNEEEYGTLALGEADDERVLEAIAAHPRLLQRPVVVCGERALIAKPPALLDDFLQSLPSLRA